jgi:hypothetical protein
LEVGRREGAAVSGERGRGRERQSEGTDDVRTTGRQETGRQARWLASDAEQQRRSKGVSVGQREGQGWRLVGERLEVGGWRQGNYQVRGLGGWGVEVENCGGWR